MDRSEKRYHDEYGLVGVVLAIVSGVAHWLILEVIEPVSVSLLLLFAADNFWQGYHASSNGSGQPK